MKDLLENVRFYVLLSTFLISLGVFFYVRNFVPSGTIQTIKLTQMYALISVFYLYITLLASPLLRYFKFIPFKTPYIKSRRALGVSAFYFGALHGYLAFFKQLGGFEGLGFLSSKYLIAISLSFVALVILTAMAATANDKAIEKLGFTKWKSLHRLVYLAGILILVHALMLGTHFADLSAIIPKIFFVMLSFLLILESKRFDDYLSEKFNKNFSFGVSGVLVLAGSIYFLLNYVFNSNRTASLGIHATHLQLAKSGQQTKLSVSLSPFDKFLPGRKTNLSFKVFDAATGESVKDFEINQEKLMHVIIVSEDLSYFDHVHPELKSGVFSLDYTFPKSGYYRIYTDFKPKNLVEQQFPFKIAVGEVAQETVVINPNFETTKEVNGFLAKLTLPEKLSAKSLTEGREIITIKLTDKNGQDVKSITPYLGAFGHLIMIRTGSYDYVHVHPKQAYTPFEGETSGPLVQFSPLGLYGDIKPGVYKMYAQFMIESKLYIFDFFVKLDK